MNDFSPLIFVFQVQALKVLVNLSSNPDMMDDIVQAQVRIIYVGHTTGVVCMFLYNAQQSVCL